MTTWIMTKLYHIPTWAIADPPFDDGLRVTVGWAEKKLC
jgi:hypothetical protein